MTTPADTPAAAAPAALGPDDFDTLDALLDQLRTKSPDTPEWEFCEGVMAALICTRRPIPAEEVWPVLFDEGFNPAENMELVWFWRRRWAEIEAALDADVQTLDEDRCYHPEVLDVRGAIAALPEDERARAEAEAAAEGGLPAFGQVWAHGFLAVVEQWEEDWAPPRDREAAQLLGDAIDAIAVLAGPDHGRPEVSMYEEDGPPTVSQARLDAWGEAIWAVYDLRRLWKSQGPRAESVRREALPGRNDPCFCGSGKKFKKCHGG
ncbi:UPF0149 family protein [Xylophilus sp.]|uniref:UPF0149 family protein n=1 Tax=Xylophilus sp. TaxID=2653893 RepID=UPI0013B63498|nr:UPF0149 family protein [Xylophilus sp.]KAF1044706.1 MAG: hypothetical protein GAK38_03424 [Xylophilus sp.]